MAGTGVGVGAPLLAPVWKGQDGELRLFAQTLNDELVGHFKMLSSITGWCRRKLAQLGGSKQPGNGSTHSNNTDQEHAMNRKIEHC